jgi:hypothetical protein
MSLVSIDQSALPYMAELCFAGADCYLTTNSADLAEVLQQLSLSLEATDSTRFMMQVVVDETSTEQADNPHFRGLHHVVTASFGHTNVFVFDLLRRTLSANVSSEVAKDSRFWKEKLIPITLGILGSALGLIPVHSACLESEGDGLLIAGASGAGKSTLSVALSLAGFNYISDDWTYLSLRDGVIVAHGTSAPVKLLPDADQHFQALAECSPHISMNGELAYEVDIIETFGVAVECGCEPRWLIFLERVLPPGSEFSKLSSSEARDYLTSNIERLPSQLDKAARNRDQLIEAISALPCWTFRYGGTPQFASEQLVKFVADRRHEVSA